jgi:tellurite resistance protein TehA-like permease
MKFQKNLISKNLMQNKNIVQKKLMQLWGKIQPLLGKMQPLSGKIQPQLKFLSPRYFSFVMATEIVSIALLRQEYDILSGTLYYLGMLGYFILAILYGYRFIHFKKEVKKEFLDTIVSFEFFTFMAGSDALAVRSVMAEHNSLAVFLATIGIFLTTLFVYYVLSLLFVHHKKPLNESINPTWLLMVVAIQSVSLITSHLLENHIWFDENLWLISFGFFSFGIFIYFIFMPLILNVSFFTQLDETKIKPAYWMIMGASAISVAAAGNLILDPNAPAFIMSYKPFIGALLSFLWVWSTAWIPLLILLEIWKYAYRKLPFQYTPALWGMVFPIGMYGVATLTFAKYSRLEILHELASNWAIIAFLVWLFVFISLLNHCKQIYQYQYRK